MSKLVFVYSIPRPTATGISDWVSSSSGIKLKKTKVGRSADFLVALPSQKLGGLANYISYNYKTNPLTGEIEKDEEGNPLTLQAALEKKWGKPKGFFSNAIAPISYKGDGTDLGYYYNKRWILQDGCTVFDLDKMDDEIGYYVLLASNKVANSEREYREYKWPKATHYIALENESEELKYQKSKAKTKAWAALDSDSISPTYKLKFVGLLGIASPSSKLSHETVHNKLYEYISATSTANNHVEKFLNLVTMLKTVDGKNKLEAMYLLKRAEESRVIYQKQDVWTWIRQSGVALVIGDKYPEAVDFLLNPKKQDEREELEKQVDAKFI